MARPVARAANVPVSAIVVLRIPSSLHSPHPIKRARPAPPRLPPGGGTGRVRASGARGSWSLRHRTHGDPGSDGSTDHVCGSATAGEGQDEVGLALVTHLLVS